MAGSSDYHYHALEDGAMLGVFRLLAIANSPPLLLLLLLLMVITIIALQTCMYRCSASTRVSRQAIMRSLRWKSIPPERTSRRGRSITLGSEVRVKVGVTLGLISRLS